MLKTFSQILILCALLSVVTVVVLLFYYNSSHLIYLPQADFLGNATNSFSNIIKKGLDKLLEKQSYVLNAGQQAEEPAPMDTLDPCPDHPQNLIGPFSVDFSHSWTWNEVRRKISTPLQDGGRHKPADCVSKHKVAIIIPYRNRHEHLKHLLFYLHPMLVRQQLDYGIYVINQDGEGVFNRAKLMNVGFAEALKDYDYECFVFSDVDLVPMDDRNFYRCFKSPRHLSVAIDKFNFQLPYNTIFGGVSSFSKQQFLTVNGYSNTYWGWGGEDDDMYKRIIFHGMSINRPEHMTGKYKMIKHQRDKNNEVNPKNPDKLFHTRETMDKDGINTLNYTVKEIVKDRLYTFINVDIKAPKNILSVGMLKSV
ncbi:beta-1,4-galactosyltransferase 1-like [Takifugu rubripes]|uniref:Beta-1,4-galactosyltransferase n=1 Tax=Takifugu rubripes TaxID=31033 RepID=A0A3B5K480_TAKRU|nr:beta-1,4-galactosyltransferase 1-like [Takifugu rubripes]|eukprot:XP_003967957.2 PREDICTED: beta-1,4-galactosyltransferase 1-like [Takifugu rubripes]